MSSALRTWLRRNPQPASIRFRDVDDEVRTLKLSENVRCRFKDAEDALVAAQAVSVEALDGHGAVLRAIILEVEDNGVVDEDEREEKRADKIIAKERRELAAVLDHYGHRLNEAYVRGSEATARGQEQLVSLVDILTSHLTAAITNMHATSARLAKVLGDEGGAAADDKNSEMVAQVLGAAAMKFLGSSPAAPAADKPKPNGKG
jgi:hypothetical protein